ncbi:BMP family lipoprotein [Halococcus agarilyticus]|uniref:BMP family lipoprotein n=1 Tax=Halococcus agarilyticus TaxID=1232219 RepID=UPI0006781E4D|nr:BMP family protein [Halococcus agarilyticus]
MRTNSGRRRFLQIAGTAGLAGLAGCTSGGGGSGSGSGNGSNGSGESGGSGGDTGTESSGTDTESGDETSTESSGAGNESGGNASSGNASGNESAGSSTDGSDMNVGMIYAKGGLGDKSFNDSANRGVKRAADELGISFNNAQPEQNSDFPTFQRRFAQSSSPNYDLICTIGFAQVSGLTEVAPNFPDQKFMLVDGVVEESNVASYTFKEHQGSFQVGHLAGLLTTREMSAGAGETNPENATLGFVGGEEVPLIKRFQAGFEAGAAHANEEANVRVAYTGSFADPGAGKEAAVSMYDNGADIVYHAAGGSGIGVFQAAQEQGRYAIGVDSAQSRSSPQFANVILASMVKRVNNAVYTSIENVANDSFNGGEITTLGLEQNGVEAVYGTELGSAIPKEVKQSLEQSEEAIVSGDISVPTEPGQGG